MLFPVEIVGGLAGIDAMRCDWEGTQDKVVMTWHQLLPILGLGKAVASKTDHKPRAWAAACLLPWGLPTVERWTRLLLADSVLVMTFFPRNNLGHLSLIS